MAIRAEYRRARILDFDCEARPIAFYGGDFVTKQITAIAWRFIGERTPVEVHVIGGSYDTRNVLAEERAMLLAFVAAYDQADMVTGHYIRRFDLPLVNGSLMRLGLPGLKAKMTQDTKDDLRSRHGLSASQENLAAMWELKHPKVGMDTAQWTEANMLLPRGIEKAKKRVVGDVRQHQELRQKMIDYDVLRAPRVWRP